MVTRPGNLHKTPPGSRGTSPSRSSNGIVVANGIAKKPTSRRVSPAQSPNRTGRSPVRSSPKKSSVVGGSPDRRRKPTTPDRGSRGSSPAEKVIVQEELPPRSRGSDSGSIERLDDDNNLQRIITSYNQTDDNINVVVRVRPVSTKESKSGDVAVVQFPGNGQILVDGIPGGPSGGQKPKLFSYNVVFEAAATQEDVLQFSGMKRLIEMGVEGFRCTAFCYGQTGSGKTHTLTGPPGLFGVRTAPFSDKHGLVFRSFLYLFQLIKEKPDVHFILKASYLEIYNEKVIDLLNPGSARKPLAVRWSKKARGFFVENLFTVDCEELDDLIAVLEEGLRNRSVGRHNMNDFSSRSHTILTVYITSEQPAENGVFLSRSGKLNFVDLAGSEMTKKTQSEGKTLEEANNINKSLMVLGYCISSLSDSKRKGTHIPYRDSKLTKLLADSLAGNGVTLMIACVSPVKSNISETLNTLRYAARAKRIRTKPIVLMDPREALILSLKREVSVLQSENEHLRSALNVYSGSSDGDLPSSERRVIVTPPHVDLEKLAELEGPQLADLVRLYIIENEALRKENSELYASKEVLQRDHEIVCHENERLLKKLEEVNSVCCRSPLIQARPSFSAEILNNPDLDSSAGSNVWSPDPVNSKSSPAGQIPESIQKELDKRQIKATGGIQAPKRGHRRNKSLEETFDNSKDNRVRSSESDGSGDIGQSDSNKATGRQKGSPKRRFSMAKAASVDQPTSTNPQFSEQPIINPLKQQDHQKASKAGLLERNHHVFGSIISLTDEEDEA